jgi:hypothetical protein
MRCDQKQMHRQYNFHTNHFKNALFRDFLVPANLDGPFAAVHLPPNGGGGLVFDDISDYPNQARLGALLGQRDASQLSHYSLKQKQAWWGNIRQRERVAHRLYAFAAFWSLGLKQRRGLGNCPFTEISPGMMIWTFLALKSPGAWPEPSWSTLFGFAARFLNCLDDRNHS